MTSGKPNRSGSVGNAGVDPPEFVWRETEVAAPERVRGLCEHLWGRLDALDNQAEKLIRDSNGQGALRSREGLVLAIRGMSFLEMACLVAREASRFSEFVRRVVSRQIPREWDEPLTPNDLTERLTDELLRLLRLKARILGSGVAELEDRWDPWLWAPRFARHSFTCGELFELGREAAEESRVRAATDARGYLYEQLVDRISPSRVCAHLLLCEGLDIVSTCQRASDAARPAARTFLRMYADRLADLIESCGVFPEAPPTSLSTSERPPVSPTGDPPELAGDGPRGRSDSLSSEANEAPDAARETMAQDVLTYPNQSFEAALESRFPDESCERDVMCRDIARANFYVSGYTTKHVWYDVAQDDRLEALRFVKAQREKFGF